MYGIIETVIPYAIARLIGIVADNRRKKKIKKRKEARLYEKYDK